MANHTLLTDWLTLKAQSRNILELAKSRKLRVLLTQRPVGCHCRQKRFERAARSLNVKI